jgi:hypothetical protein
VTGFTVKATLILRTKLGACSSHVFKARAYCGVFFSSPAFSAMLNLAAESVASSKQAEKEDEDGEEEEEEEVRAAREVCVRLARVMVAAMTVSSVKTL